MSDIPDRFEQSLRTALNAMAERAPNAPPQQQIRRRLHRRTILRSTVAVAGGIGCVTLAVTFSMLSRAPVPQTQRALTYVYVNEPARGGEIPAVSIAIPPIAGCGQAHAMSSAIPQLSVPLHPPSLAIPPMHVSSVSLSISF